MRIISRLSTSADGYVTSPDGWPAQLADPAFVSGQSHGIQEFLQGKEAALMGRTTFEPALDRPVAVAEPGRVRARVPASAGHPRRRGHRQRPPHGCWRDSAPPIGAATSISSAARARLRPSAPWGRWTNSNWSCCRCHSETGCS